MKKIKLILIWLSMAVFLSGCSFRFVYNHLDWWTHWYLDDYVTLTEQQQQRFDDEFEQLHLWHRTTQLPAYVQQLKALKMAINDQINEQDIAANFVQFTEHWQNFLIATEPKLQPLVVSLSTEQTQQLLQALQEAHQERLDDDEALSEQDWLEERTDQQKEQLKDWFGKLSPEQKSQVTLLGKGYQRSFEPRMLYRQRWTQQFADLLNGNLPDHEFKLEFYRLFVDGRRLRDEKFNAMTNSNNQVFTNIFLYMVTTATNKQRKRINKKIDKILGDLAYLINDD